MPFAPSASRKVKKKRQQETEEEEQQSSIEKKEEADRDLDSKPVMATSVQLPTGCHKEECTGGKRQVAGPGQSTKKKTAGSPQAWAACQS